MIWICWPSKNQNCFLHSAFISYYMKQVLREAAESMCVIHLLDKMSHNLYVTNRLISPFYHQTIVKIQLVTTCFGLKLLHIAFICSQVHCLDHRSPNCLFLLWTISDRTFLYKMNQAIFVYSKLLNVFQLHSKMLCKDSKGPHYQLDFILRKTVLADGTSFLSWHLSCIFNCGLWW